MQPNNAPHLFLGVGLSDDVTAAAALTLVEEAIVQCGVPHPAIAAIATIAARRDHPVITALASHFRCDIRYFDAATLDAETPRLKNPSPALFARIGCHGVAEAAALAAAGKHAVLIVEKMTGLHVTVAIAMEAVVF
jgi:cobalamin biosynthesis protein CbiG